ncbi:MAG: bifunctional hydroxymethylpyrimidine kinase/phosphomethylpyrimidine kinase [bacterium]|nr:bifunctional hydroxymethylpyrimidine kinase/phosphomethylpyrimidine kinase [bacterium]
MNARRLTAILDRFSSKKIMVLGDLIADEYLFTHCSRISREAPVLILKYESRKIVLGGGANAVHNVCSLGAKVVPLSVVGEDEMGEYLLSLMQGKGISTDLVYRARGYQTTTKTRVLAGSHHTAKQQVVRIDREMQTPVDGEVEEFIIQSLAENIDLVDALLVSDYGLGVCSARVREAVSQLAAEQPSRIITIDSRYELLSYRRATALTPNEPEIEQALGRKLKTEDDLKLCGQMALDKTGSKNILITRGQRGMFLLEQTGDFHFIPIYGQDEVADVTGAGDTVISTFTLALSAGATPLEAAQLANYAGGIKVTKSGTAPVFWQELRDAVEGEGAGEHE